MKAASWIICKKTTGEAIVETFNKKIVDAINTDKYKATPILEYLISLNKGNKS